MPANPRKESLKVAITTGINCKGLELFCPDSQLKWGNCRFILNPSDGLEFDYWICFARLSETTTLKVDPRNTLFISGEPPSKRVYDKRFYAQFNHVVSCHANDPHPRVTVSYLGLPWYVGRSFEKKAFIYGYDYLADLKAPQKENKISVVCSNQTKTKGQQKRLEFLEKAASNFGDRLVHFGRGFTPIEDKMEAILPHRYHLVLENSRIDHYWTEKLADAYLGWSSPIYHGAPNVDRYFPQTSLTQIDCGRPDEALKKMEALLKMQPQEVRLKEIEHCRKLVLNKYNLFSRFSFWAEKFHVPSDLKPVTKITPHKNFQPFHRRSKQFLRRPCLG